MDREPSISREGETPMPQALGAYRVRGVLGSGGMGIVYLGQHEGTGQQVALKTVRVPHDSMLASIRLEVRALSRIQHPRIVRILDHGVSGGLPWYAMELLESRTLRQLLERHYAVPGTRSSTTFRARRGDTLRGPKPEGPSAPGLPARALLQVVHDLCEPLAYLHGRGLVHCDLKPGNIFIQRSGAVVLGDFGTAAEFAGALGREHLHVDTVGMGTLLYMAPEQIRGELVDARADLYSLGCILYECATGMPPFIGASTRVIRRLHLQEPPTPPSLLTEEPLPERLEWLILKLLEKQPEDRLGYAEDVARVLTGLGLDADGGEHRPAPLPYLYRPRFTGREDALRQLRERLLHQGGEVFIGGGSGVGKTRLALEAAREALHREIPVVTCECIPLGASGLRADADVRAPALHPFRSLLASVADRCRNEGAEETARLLGPKGKVLVPYEPYLDELPGQQQLLPPPTLTNPEAARARTFASLQEVLFAFAEDDPLLLIIDDLQWADEMTLGFLQQLRLEDLAARGVLLLGTYRMEEQRGVLAELVSRSGAVRLELGLLDERSIRSMVCSMLALQELPRDFDGLVRQAEGNPFFVGEYLRAAIAEGLLHRDEQGQWRLRGRARAGAGLERLGLPDSIAEIIHRRLRDLDPGAQALVELAAVLGRECDADLLLEAAPLRDTTALEALQTLRVRQIVEQTPGNRMRFLHDKLREISYAAISPEQRRSLHRRAADAIEQRYQRARDFALYFPSLANHWAQAQVHDQACRYFRLAADRARAVHANGDAITFFRAALAEARQHLGPERAGQGEWQAVLLHLHEGLGDVLALTGRQDEARAAYAEALVQLLPDERLHRASLLRKTGKTWETHHLHDEALRAYDDAESALGPEPGTVDAPGPEPGAWWREWLQIQEDRHWTWYWMDRREEMAALVSRVRPVLERHGTPMQRSRFFVVFANTSFRQERYAGSSQVVEYGRLAVEAGEASGDPATRALALFCHAFTLVLHGDFDEAEKESLAGLRLAELTGDLTLRSRLLTYLTVVYRRRGDVDRTRDTAEQSLEAASAARMTDYVGAARANRAWVAWREQHMDEAGQEARAALECWGQLAAVYPYPFQWQALWVLLELALRRQAIAEAMEHTRALLAPTQQQLPDPLVADLDAALHVWDGGHREAAREYLTHAASAARRWKYL
jgi:serine/threonine protein kinase